MVARTTYEHIFCPPSRMGDVAALKVRLLELATDNARLRERVEELECEEREERDDGGAAAELQAEFAELKAEFESRCGAEEQVASWF